MKTLLYSLIGLLICQAGQAQEKFELRENGTIPVWLVAGPMHNGDPGAHGDECLSFAHDLLTEQGGEAQYRPSEGDTYVYDEKEFTWQPAFSQRNGMMDAYKSVDVDRGFFGSMYAFCTIETDGAQEVQLEIKHSSGFVAYLNGEEVYKLHRWHRISDAPALVKVQLKKGPNHLMVKSETGWKEWGFQIKLLGKDNEPFTDAQVSVETEQGIKESIVGAEIYSTPLVLRDGNRQLLKAEIMSGGVEEAVFSFSLSGKEYRIAKGDLPAGLHVLDLPVEEQKQDSKDVEVTISTSTGKTRVKAPLVEKSKHWRVFFVQHTHTDIGYTRPQSEILPEHLRYIDYALDMCELTDGYPDDAQFRWMCEVSWPVVHYVMFRPKEQVERLRKRVDEGRIELGAMKLQMSELADETALAMSLMPIRYFREQGMSVTSAMQNDVNGAGWCLVDYFADAGIESISMGINETRSIRPFDKPTVFWWESPSGKRIIGYRPDHYMTGNQWGLHDGDIEGLTNGVIRYINELESKGHPYPAFSAQYSGYYTDNAPPNKSSSDLVRQWNETYAWPRLRCSVQKDFIDHVKSNYSDKLKVYKVAWPDWWTDGFGSAARETAQSRISQVEANTSNTLIALAMLAGGQPNMDAVLSAMAKVQEQLLFYYEHTFGAAESISDPQAENTQVQWGEKSSYLWCGAKKAGMLREYAMGLMQPHVPATDKPAIVVFNTLNWERSGLFKVFIDHKVLPKNAKYRLIDAQTGEEVFAQKDKSRHEGSYWHVWADHVPALGYKLIYIELLEGKQSNEAEYVDGHIIENQYYKISVDKESGAITSIYDKELNKELVDKDAQWGFGSYLYETLKEGRSFMDGNYQREGLSQLVSVKTSECALWKSIDVAGKGPGLDEIKGFNYSIVLFNKGKQIGLYYILRKEKVEEGEAIYIPFLFDMADAKMQFEGQGGLVEPGKNQLPGSSSDWHTVQNFISIENQDAEILLGSREVPLVQFSEINLGKWMREGVYEKPHVYSWVMNNYWFTNFRASQEGDFAFSYYIKSAAGYSDAEMYRAGYEAQVPMEARALLPRKKSEGEAAQSFLQTGADNLLLINARPAQNEQNAVLLHLRETAGQTATLKLSGPVMENVQNAEEVNVLEESLGSEGSLIFEPYESKFILLRLK